MRPSTKRRKAGVWAVTLAALTATLATVSPAPVSADGLTTPLVNPVWLCAPGMPSNPCNQDAAGNPVESPGIVRYPDGSIVTLDATRVVGGAPAGVDRFTSTPNPPVDCFYVYPTVDLASNPVLEVGANPPTARPNETAVMLAQVARFTGLCRMFVPLYRQDTLPQLAWSIVTGTDGYPGPGFGDIQQAWNDYWAHDNIDPATGKRRGVILLGHSQGSVAVEKLIQSSVDGNPDVTRQLVSAILLGGKVQVPIGQPAGGGADANSTFQHLPLCQARSDGSVPVGCVVAYSSYLQAAGSAPGSDSLAWSAVAGHQMACVNPADLLRGTTDAVTPLDADMPTQSLVQGNVLNPNGNLALVMLGYTLTQYQTGFAHYPGALTGQCEFATGTGGTASWLQIGGDTSFLPASASTSALGLHVADYNVALGDLQNLLAAQSADWLRSQ